MSTIFCIDNIDYRFLISVTNHFLKMKVLLEEVESASPSRAKASLPVRADMIVRTLN